MGRGFPNPHEQSRRDCPTLKLQEGKNLGQKKVALSKSSGPGNFHHYLWNVIFESRMPHPSFVTGTDLWVFSGVNLLLFAWDGKCHLWDRNENQTNLTNWSCVETQVDNRVPTLIPSPGKHTQGSCSQWHQRLLPAYCVYVIPTLSKMQVIFTKCPQYMVVFCSPTERSERKMKRCWCSMNTRGIGLHLKFTISRQPEREIVEKWF